MTVQAGGAGYEKTPGLGQTWCLFDYFQFGILMQCKGGGTGADINFGGPFSHGR